MPLTGASSNQGFKINPQPTALEQALGIQHQSDTEAPRNRGHLPVGSQVSFVSTSSPSTPKGKRVNFAQQMNVFDSRDELTNSNSQQR